VLNIDAMGVTQLVVIERKIPIAFPVPVQLQAGRR